MSMTREVPKIFVTGAPGWLGTRLVQTIAHGHGDNAATAPAFQTGEISILSQPQADARALKEFDPRIRCHTGDLRSETDVNDWLRGAEGALVFHIAGIIHPAKSADFWEINEHGGRRVLSACEKYGARRIVVMSSNSPFGTNPHPDHLFDESSPYNPYMGYGKSKMALEYEVARHQLKGRLQTVIIRAPWFYGPNQPPRQSLFFSMIRNGKAPIVGNGENKRSMTYIDNLCQGLLLAALHDEANGKAYWIADERPYTMNEIVNTVEQLLEEEFQLKCAHNRMRLPGFASSIAYAVDAALQRAGFYHQKIHVLSEMNKSIACDVSLAKRELGYAPKYDLRAGMRESIRWALAHGHQI